MNLPEPNSGDSDSAQSSISHTTGETPSTTSRTQSSEPSPSSSSSQDSETVSPDLNDWLVSQRSAEPSPSLYPVSPAESYNLTSYSVSPLDEPTPEAEKPSGWQTAWAVIREVGETIILTLVIFFL